MINAYGNLGGIRTLLAGKKTYLVGLLQIALGILQDDQQMILTGISVMTLRAGIGSK